jgi:hypothetical protein
MGLTFDSSYAVSDEGHVYAWGYNVRGQLGIGSTSEIVSEPSPVLYADPAGDVWIDDAGRVFRTDGSHECAEVSTPDSHAGARFLCWGGDDAGELGRGVLDAPGEIFRVSQAAVAIPNTAYGLVFGEDHGCAVVPAETHQVQCWGRGGFVGDGRYPETPGAQIKPPQLSVEPVQWLLVPP